MVVGAIDRIGILSQWREALINVSWVSTFLTGSAAAFRPLVQSL